MKVWGIDPSSQCGIAIWDTTTNISSVHCEVIANKVTDDFYFYSVQMGRKLSYRAKEFGKPDLVVIEQGSLSTQGMGVDGLIWVWNCISAVTSFVGVLGRPIATITPGKWRKPFYGEGFLPPQKPVMEKGKQVWENGKPKFKNDWKAAAVTKCETLGITLPTQKTISHNAAEAVGITHSWAHAKIINEEFSATFVDLRKAWNSKPERVTDPHDLFHGVAA